MFETRTTSGGTSFFVLFCLSGNYVEDFAGNELLDVVLTTPQLQSYAVHKLFFCLREGSTTSPVLSRVRSSFPPRLTGLSNCRTGLVPP